MTAVILAGGKSSRMGRDKLKLNWRNTLLRVPYCVLADALTGFL